MWLEVSGSGRGVCASEKSRRVIVVLFYDMLLFYRFVLAAHCGDARDKSMRTFGDHKLLLRSSGNRNINTKLRKMVQDGAECGGLSSGLRHFSMTGNDLPPSDPPPVKCLLVAVFLMHSQRKQ